MRITATVLSLFLTLSVYSSSHEHMDHKHHGEHKTKMMKRKPLDEKSKNEVISLYAANEKLFDAFFEYDSKKIEAEAKNLIQAIDKISHKEIKKLLEFSKTKLLELKKDNEQKRNNHNYNLISMAMIHVLSKYDLGDTYNAYYCPMVKKKWIQNSKKVKKVSNPYDSRMPHCGSQETNF
jgi:predicted RNA-binding Zn-ribbon protein involved in translation (DUF1610 family)